MPAKLAQGLALILSLCSPALSLALRDSQKVLQTNYRASLPVTNPTKSFWTHGTADANPLATEGSQGALTSEADVCIIGSGITGTSVAYHLSQLVKASNVNVDGSLDVVILEARDFCSGATGRNGGHLTPETSSGFVVNEKLWGKDEAIRAAEIERHVFDEVSRIIGEHGLADKVDFVPSGRTVMAYTDELHKSLKLDYETARAAGVDVSEYVWLSKKQTKELYGASYPAVHIPGSGLWPLKLVTQLYRLAKEASPAYNLTLHTRTAVTSFAPAPSSPSRKWSLQTPRGSVECSYVVHATNAYTSYLLPQFEIVPTRGQIIAVRANASLEELTDSAFLLKHQYWLTRPTNSSEPPLIIIGGGRQVEGPEQYTTNDSIVNPLVGSYLRAFLPDEFPDKFVAGREPVMEWTGIMGYTLTGDPYVGPIQDTQSTSFDGQYIAAGFTGHGMPRAFGAAEAVAQMLIANLSGTQWEAPSWFPRHYLTTV